MYEGSLFECLKALYPDHPWERWRAHRKNKQYWAEPANIRQALDQLQTTLKLQDLSDWYRISVRQMNEYGFRGLLKHYGNIASAIKAAYPHVQWEEKMFSKRGKKSAQRWLLLKVQDLFSDQHILEDFRHPQLRIGRQRLELDLFLPGLNLAFEYQGEQHYSDLSPSAFSPLELYEERDRIKKQLCRDLGISLVQVPYWWDRQLPSLRATITEACPEVSKLLGTESAKS
jgi:hypothetical protein